MRFYFKKIKYIKLKVIKKSDYFFYKVIYYKYLLYEVREFIYGFLIIKFNKRYNILINRLWN